MKKTLFLIIALLFTVSVFAHHKGVPEPECKDGKLLYIDPNYMWADACVHGLDEPSPASCYETMQKMGEEKFNAYMIKFLKERRKELCGK